MKIAHFEEPDDTTLPVEKQAGDKDRSDLGALYPTAKTYEQNQRASQRQLQHRIDMEPKYPQLQIALFGASIFGFFVWFLQQIETQILDANRDDIMATVFFVFLLALALFGIVLWWTKFTNAIFEFAGKTGNLFWSLTGSFAIIGSVASMGGFQNLAFAKNALVLTVLFFCIVLVLAHVVLKNPTKQ